MFLWEPDVELTGPRKGGPQASDLDSIAQTAQVGRPGWVTGWLGIIQLLIVHSSYPIKMSRGKILTHEDKVS